MAVDDEHDLSREPHLKPQSGVRDPSEQVADQQLAHDAKAGDIEEEQARHSVFNEPAGIYPEGSPAHTDRIIDRDWACDHCGYNLRGLHTDHPCPECGEVSIYHPAPLDVTSYASWLSNRLDDAKKSSNVLFLFGLALAGGLWSIITAIFLEGMQVGGQLLSICVFAPVIEEIMKVGALAILVERRPYRFKSRTQIIVVALGAAFIFATIENALYLLVFIANPTPEMIAWRIVVCTALHMGCTFIAARALTDTWTQSVEQFREPKLDGFTRGLILAIIIHGTYNASMVLLEWSGFWF